MSITHLVPFFTCFFWHTLDPLLTLSMAFFPLQLVYFSNFSNFLLSKQKIIFVSFCLKSFHTNSISVCSKVPTSSLFQCLPVEDIFHSPLVQNYNFSFCFINLINYFFSCCPSYALLLPFSDILKLYFNCFLLT